MPTYHIPATKGPSPGGENKGHVHISASLQGLPGKRAFMTELYFHWEVDWHHMAISYFWLWKYINCGWDLCTISVVLLYRKQQLWINHTQYLIQYCFHIWWSNLRVVGLCLKISRSLIFHMLPRSAPTEASNKDLINSHRKKSLLLRYCKVLASAGVMGVFALLWSILCWDQVNTPQIAGVVLVNWSW